MIKIQLGKGTGCLGEGEACTGGRQLGGQYVKLPDLDVEIRLGPGKSRFGLAFVTLGILISLLRGGFLSVKPLLPGIFLKSSFLGGQGRGDLCFCLSNNGVLQGRGRLRIGDGGFGRQDIRFGLSRFCRVIAFIDGKE
ncbi:hypothetical protein EDC59_101424 [Pseudodesulfovibrio indicus]|uniref:Uncharacterized protein n=1 Tax=Pseudodesulfovibrio indicus TaxID=1716143 RepID=A0AA94TKJ9_9BACT|nr:hypothetical protein EDC59_101424 [Pseudodesulfovibrio indicus]